MSVTVTVADYAKAFPEIRAIRAAVFQVEQGVSEELEFDGKDETATHLLARSTSNQQAIGTARIRFLSQNQAKIERLAVLKEARGSGAGQALMEAAIAFLADQGVAEALIHAQAYLQAFYEKLGFVPEGDIFDEAGIPHLKMRKRLRQNANQQ
jgi:predicted GNAT family N-acyltransferase